MTETDQRYTIGELARLCGVPVRRIRFYSDKGLLPPATRTMANYRVYSNADAARLDLIQALRAMGTSLAAIQGILARKGSLAELLALAPLSLGSRDRRQAPHRRDIARRLAQSRTHRRRHQETMDHDQPVQYRHARLDRALLRRGHRRQDEPRLAAEGYRGRSARIA